MSELFWGLFDIWNVIKDMAWQINIVILLVLLCRIFVGKVSKQASYFLWVIVALRLLVPVMPESGFSVFNATQPELFQANTFITEERTTSESPSQDNVGTILQNPSEHVTNMMEDVDGTYENVGDNAGYTVQQFPSSENITPETLQFLQVDWMFLVWLAGVVFMAAYGVISYVVLKYKLRFATSNDHRVYEDEHISSPFVFGIIKPCVYLPYRLSKEEREYILKHENYHIKRRDYLVKILAFGLLSVYWFQPLVWVAFYLMSRDMEMSCDEQVLKELGMEDRKAYSTLLLSFASNKRFPLPSPLSFGENDTKSRIKQILNYKSPTLWGIIAVIVLILVVAICCLTDAQQDTSEDTQTESTEAHAEMSDEEILAFAESLYEVKNPYIGDVSANGKVLNLLRGHYNITGMAGIELQTYEQPFWITVSFNDKPDDTSMWKLAAVFLTLTENASEFRWEFVEENDKLYTYYVQVEDIEEVLGCDDLKSYADSAEKIAELLVLLDEKETGVTKSLDDVSYEINKHLSYSLFSNYADEADIPWEVANQYELRLMEDGVIYRNDEYKAIYECIYKDFDKSGEMDFALYIRDLGYGESTLYIYMNDDPLYTHILPISCWSMEILSGDIDHDGNTELVYSAHNGGVGGAGGYVKGILKYKNLTFTQMEMPGDFSEEELSDGDAGYNIEVYFGKEENLYRVVCPSVKDFGVIESEYLKNEDGSYFVQPYEGVAAGANCRGFDKLYIIQEHNQDYLMAEEYFHGEGGVNHGLGYMRFIFDWSDTEGWVVKGATVHPYVKSTTSDTDIFEEMKHEILYYPDDYDDLLQNWSNIPVINYKDGSVYEPYDQLTQYAYMTTRNMSTGSLIYAKLNEKEELTYIYVNYQDDKYYYLEDYTRVSDKPYYTNGDDYFQKVYNYGIYFSMKYPNGNCFEHFYLTNEENLSKDDIFDSRSSLQYASKFITVYTKQLDEEGVKEYTRCTGDFIEQDIKITMPLNRSWIGNPVYNLSDGVVCGTYSDFIIDADMIVCAGEEEAVFEKARAGLKENLEEWDCETWSAKTADGEYIEIELYLEQLGATNYNTVVAKWEYEGNIYLLYGDTQETDGSPVAKTAIHIIEHFEKNN